MGGEGGGGGWRGGDTGRAVRGWLVMRQSHIHDAILASALSFVRCASSTLDQRYAFVVIRCVRQDFCACTNMCVELDA